MGDSSRAIKCLDCDTIVNPLGTWEQCQCGHLYVDRSGETTRVGFIDEDRVEYPTDTKLGPKKAVKRTGDKYTGSGTFE